MPPEARQLEAAASVLPVVCLVASAGGLAAVTEVLGGLEADFGAAVVVLIHQPPERPSRLGKILDRRSILPVAVAEDGTTLARARVLVLPNGEHGVVGPYGKLDLFISGAAPPSRPSADLLLTSAAIARPERVIAVVLSGNGHDGATGATAVHRFGGMVIASDRATTEVFSMPEATIDRDHVIDHVLPQHAVAAKLNEVVRSWTS